MDHALRQHYLTAMGIQTWQTRDQQACQVVTETQHQTQTATIDPATMPVAMLTWEQLQQRVQACTQCELHRSRTQTVFGVGDRQANLLIVGEAPGAHEDRQGKPFVGRAGQLLNSMLQAIGLNREQVYIANILKCRPPNNRDPKPEETRTCTPFLERQVALLAPKVILAVGRIATHYLLNTTSSMGRLRGKRYQFRDTEIPLIVSYHPAYLLRSPREKMKSYADLLLVKQILEEIN